MKKLFAYGTIAALALFASCQKVEQDAIVPAVDPVFTATIQATKTSINTADGKVSWSTDDEITITDAASVSVVYTVASITGDKATFTKKSGETGTLGAGPYTAVYGAAPTTAQTYSADAANLPMTASSATTDLTFSVSCGLLEVTLTKDGENIIKVEVSDGTTTYALNCATAVSIASGAAFHVAVPAGNYTSFTITNENGGVCRKSGGAVSVGANQIQPISFSKLAFTYIVHTAAELYDAIDAAKDGDKIMLASGTYTATKTFEITKNITLEGGYGTAPALGDTPDPANLKATLDGDEKYQVMKISANVVADQSVKLSGLIITKGKPDNALGAGLYILTKGTVVLDYVDFIDNINPSKSGAGFCITGTSIKADFTNCIISGNSAPASNGCNYVYNGAKVTFDKCVFRNNSAWGMAGGLYVYNNNAQSVSVNVFNSEFYNNTATRDNKACHGGAFYLRGDGATSGATVNLVNCTFYGNSSVNGGGAIAAYGASGKTATVNTYSCTIVGNSCTTATTTLAATDLTGGGGMWAVAKYATINNYNSIISGNTCGSDATLNDVSGALITNTSSIVGGTVGDYLASAVSSKTGWLTKAYKVKAAAASAGMNVTALKAAYTGSDAAVIAALEVDQWGESRTGTIPGACVSTE